MYFTQCDWCGEGIDVRREQYARADIKLVTLERDYRGKPETEIEPTRFFHVSPLRSRDEWDRLGLSIGVRSDELGDCCYTRALRAIEGTPSSRPDAGLEWRLLPVGAHVADVVAAEDLDPADHEPLWRTWKQGERNWVGHLKGDVPAARLGEAMCNGCRMPSTYHSAGIRTIGDLKKALAERTLTDIKGIGPRTAAMAARAFEVYRKETAAQQGASRPKQVA